MLQRNTYGLAYTYTRRVPAVREPLNEKGLREKDERKYYKNRYKYKNNIENWGDKVPGKDTFKLKYIFVP